MTSAARTLTAVTALAALIPVGTAQAAEQIGQTGTPTACSADATSYVQLALAGGQSYSPTQAGVITSWSATANSTPNRTMELLVLQRGVGSQYTVIGRDTLRTLTSPGVLNTFSGVHLPIEPAQTLGLFTPAQNPSPPCAFQTLLSSDLTRFHTGEEPSVGSIVSFSGMNTGFRLNVLAVVEPDADRDLFGDETQDMCLGTAGTANGCPSTVTIDALRQKGVKKVKVTVTVPGAGALALAGNKVKAKSTDLVAITKQQLTLGLRLTKSAKSKLLDKGKVKVKVTATYAPPGGPAGAATKKKKLKRKVKR